MPAQASPCEQIRAPASYVVRLPARLKIGNKSSGWCGLIRSIGVNVAICLHFVSGESPAGPVFCGFVASTTVQFRHHLPPLVRIALRTNPTVTRTLGLVS